ncbi:hypothetical protein A7G45_27165 [Mycolicibacterium llatzerense]|nr:hypothetical protein [Mycolicibacterium llatzerense]
MTIWPIAPVALGADTVGVTSAADGVAAAVRAIDAVVGTAAVATIDGAGEWSTVAACGRPIFFVALTDSPAGGVEVGAVLVVLPV